MLQVFSVVFIKSDKKNPEVSPEKVFPSPFNLKSMKQKKVNAIYLRSRFIIWRHVWEWNKAMQ